jgi:hypothetical protein
MAVTAEQIYEQTLVLRAQMGDEEAFGGLMELHGLCLLGFTRRMLDSAPDRVADLMQERNSRMRPVSARCWWRSRWVCSRSALW